MLVADTPPIYEDHFTVLIDLLGFSEVSRQHDEAKRLQVLNFLISLTQLRGDFDLRSQPHQSGNTTYIKPAIGTFSDHIVISYPIQKVAEMSGFDEQIAALSIVQNALDLITRIACAALSIGFLIRGGATIGKLCHASGIIFGEALVEAAALESRTSGYPRVVVSSKISSRAEWTNFADITFRKDNDGLLHLDYIARLLLCSAPPGDDWMRNVNEWFRQANALIADNLHNLEREGRLNELSKWAWFAHEFRIALERLPSVLLENLGLSLAQVKWG